MRVGDASPTRLEQIPLGSLCEVSAGPSGSQLGSLSDGPDGVPVLSPPDLTDDHTVDTRRLRRMSQSKAGQLARFTLREGDVLVVRQGTLGRLALIEQAQSDWLYGSSCLRIRPIRERILPAYLVAYLSHPPVQRAILSKALAGTVPSLNSAILREILVTVPPMDQQLAIADVLEDIDAQIKIQRQMADHLAAVRPAIFGELIQGMRGL